MSEFICIKWRKSLDLTLVESQLQIACCIESNGSPVACCMLIFSYTVRYISDNHVQWCKLLLESKRTSIVDCGGVRNHGDSQSIYFGANMCHTRACYHVALKKYCDYNQFLIKIQNPVSLISYYLCTIKPLTEFQSVHSYGD